MKKTIIALSLALILGGCASSHKVVNNTDERQKHISTQEELFYSAFVGEIMENEGQKNNAIKHYEKIIEDQYNEEYFNKLISMYEYKNDFIKAREIMMDLDFKNLYDNHNMLLPSYYLEKEDPEKAVESFLDALVLIENKKDINNIKYTTEYYQKQIVTIKFFNQDNEFYNIFIEELKNKDNSKYKFLKLISSTEGLKEPVDIYQFNGLERSIANARNIIELNDFDSMSYLLKDKNIITENKIDFINYMTVELRKFKNYEGIHDLYNLVAKNKIEIPIQLNISDFEYYYNTFKNNDALYRLEQIKDSLNPDYYFAKKGSINYRLGYKKAAKKYFDQVKSIKFLSNNENQYIQVSGKNSFDKFEISNLDKKLKLYDYAVITKNKKEQSLLIEDLLEILDETENSNENQFIDFDKIKRGLNIDLILLEDENKGLKLMKDELLNYSDIYSVNQFVYQSLMFGSNDKFVDDLVNEYRDEFETKVHFVDTLAVYLSSKGKNKEALDLYIKHNMLYFIDYEVQINIANIYKKLNNINKYNEHKKYSEMIFKQ